MRWIADGGDKISQNTGCRKENGRLQHFGGQPCEENDGVRKGQGQARQT